MLFTIFTPTYNRGYCLHRVYNSLQQQTLQNFEWIIVDDGSTDNTRELVGVWEKESNFTIIYKYQTNSGKHIAWNYGVELAQGEYFLCIDSDDSVTTNCIEILTTNLEKFWQLISGVCFLFNDQAGNKIGKDFNHDVIIESINDCHFKCGYVEGDKSFCIKTDILKRIKYPLVKALTHYPESFLWSKIQEKILFINARLGINYRGNTDQITAKNKISMAHYYANLETINCLDSYFRYKPAYFLKQYGCLVRFSFHLHISYLDMFFSIRSIFSKMMVIFCTPLGCCLYLKDKLRANK